MDLFEKALKFAAEKHSGQRRKLSDVPYIVHPCEVASIVATLTNDRETLAAAVLHDTIEDTDTTLEELEENFGKRVSLIVMTETENKREGVPPEESWKIRKQETLTMLEHTKDMSVKMLWLGDKLSNIRSYYRGILSGVDVFSKLNQKNPAEHAWYYRHIVEYLSDLKDYPAYKELVFLVNKVFEGVKDEISDN